LLQVLVDLNVAAAKILQNTHPEKIIIKEAVETIRRFISDQSAYDNIHLFQISLGLMGIHTAALQDKLDGDLALLRRAFNQRILYFRQLQEISDSVTDVVWEEATIAMALQVSLVERATLETKMNMTRARQRYLDNLVNNHDELESDEDDRACILCRCAFTRGFITQWYATLFLCRFPCDVTLLLRMVVLMYSAK
jgi:E3 ubiquitin-protein ligase SHPRH